MNSVNAIPISVWMPNTIEPHIGECIGFVPKGFLKKYIDLFGSTGVQLSMPPEVYYGTYIGKKQAEVGLNGQPVNIGVWFPMPLFFFESSLKSLLSEQYMTKGSKK